MLNADTETQPDSLEAADDALLSGQDEAPQPAQPDTAPAVQPEPQVEGQPRDDSGRFAPKSDAPPSAPTGPAPEPETPAEPVAATPPSAFKYNAEGREVEIPGSQSGTDGVFIPAAEVPKIQQLLAEGHAWSGSAQRYINDTKQRQQSLEARATAAEEQTAAVDAQLTQILGHIEQLVEESIGVPDENLWQSKLGQWLLNRRSEWGILKAEAKATRIEREREADRKELTRIQSERQEAELRPQMDTALSDAILRLGGAAQLDRPTMEKLYATLRSPRYDSIVFPRAEQDDPLNQIKKGERVIHFGVIEEEVKRVADMLAPFKTAPVAAKVPEVPAKPGVPVKKPTPPPTVSATRGPSPRKVLAEPTSKEEADRWLSEGGNDPD